MEFISEDSRMLHYNDWTVCMMDTVITNRSQKDSLDCTQTTGPNNQRISVLFFSEVHNALTLISSAKNHLNGNIFALFKEFRLVAAQERRGFVKDTLLQLFRVVGGVES